MSLCCVFNDFLVITITRVMAEVNFLLQTNRIENGQFCDILILCSFYTVNINARAGSRNFFRGRGAVGMT